VTDVSNALVNTDRYKLTQVLRNLLSNGLKFTPKGGSVSVSIKLVEEASAGKAGADTEVQRFYVVTVTDTGVGISAVSLYSCSICFISYSVCTG
jgi:signal transduction histidine kinase